MEILETLLRDNLSIAADDWSGDTFTIFDDGDACDTIDIKTLCHNYELHETSEHSMSYGGKYTPTGKPTLVLLGLSMDSPDGGFSLDIGLFDDKSEIPALGILSDAYVACVLLDLSDNSKEVLFDYDFRYSFSGVLSELSWVEISSALAKLQVEITICEYRRYAVPLYFERDAQYRADVLAYKLKSVQQDVMARIEKQVTSVMHSSANEDVSRCPF